MIFSDESYWFFVSELPKCPDLFLGCSDRLDPALFRAVVDYELPTLLVLGHLQIWTAIRFDSKTVPVLALQFAIVVLSPMVAVLLLERSQLLSVGLLW